MISVKLEVKATFILDKIMQGFFLADLFIENTSLKFQREHCFPVRMEEKLKEVLELGPQGVNTTEALVNAWGGSTHIPERELRREDVTSGHSDPRAPVPIHTLHHSTKDM